MTATDSTPVHLVGSIPLANAEAVFSAVCGTLGRRVQRIPDGETGERSNWIAWQLPLLAAHPHLEPDPDSARPRRRTADDGLAVDAPEFQFLRVRPGVAAAGLHIETRYAEHAIESFATFEALQRAGRITADARFQVSLPTPYAVASLYVAPASWSVFLPAYERAMARQVAAIARAIPAGRLAVQWDVCMEVIACEGQLTVPGDDPMAFAFAQLGQAVRDGARSRRSGHTPVLWRPRPQAHRRAPGRPNPDRTRQRHGRRRRPNPGLDAHAGTETTP